MYFSPIEYLCIHKKGQRQTERDKALAGNYNNSLTSQQIASVYYITSMVIVPAVAKQDPRQCVLSGTIKEICQDIFKLAFALSIHSNIFRIVTYSKQMAVKTQQDAVCLQTLR